MVVALARAVVLALALMTATSAVARAQGPAYVATPPTPGALYTDGQAGRYLLGGEWLYRADLGNVGLAQGWQGSTATDGWSPVSVPNSYNAGDFSSASMNGYVGWYRRDFTLPASAFPRYVPAAFRQWIVRFESVNYRATVWLNGRLLGQHAGSELPFELPLSGLRPGTNRLVVRVDNYRLLSDIPAGFGGGAWNYGGILREVYLRTAQRADLSQAVIRPSLACPACAATVSAFVTVRNVTSRTQTVSLVGRYGSFPLAFGRAKIPPHAIWNAVAVAHIAKPDLWSIDHPYLYRTTLRLNDSSGRSIGGYVYLSGIRKISVGPRGQLELNGRALRLRGVNVREQDLQTGGALSPYQLGRIVGWVRALGATVMRSDPLSPQVEELADRDGILIWSEIPVNRVVPREYLNLPGWLAGAHSYLTQNILANENHPSVLLWSIGNELPTPATVPEASYIASTAALVRRLDPTRPVAMSISSWPGIPCQAAYAPLDVIGYNDYFGWFDSGLGSTADRDALGPFMDSLHACYPNKAVAVTEFGFDGNRDGPVEERGTYQFQSAALADHLSVFASRPWMAGAMYFLLQDTPFFPGYTGGNPTPDPPFNQKGLLDLQGNPKPAWTVAQAIYHATVQIAPSRARRARTRAAPRSRR
ncbi:MAG TPA: glycoside hydrolase family 2 TIM barrel-domain containing protein [Solirubrobacteraceae bacterium]